MPARSRIPCTILIAFSSGLPDSTRGKEIEDAITFLRRKISSLSPFECYQGTFLKTSNFTARARTKARITAHVSIETEGYSRAEVLCASFAIELLL